ncbi:MAG: DNA mismatch repair endonuclease MutL [Deltaproteobacteria bacterium]|nr:DNA mismatch repair endonuclease MutL [Deltaproteobacteria bacterium]
MSVPRRPPVERLPAELANQIAAGEVVVRPASVVKELVENALDAGAGAVRVEIESGGVALCRVSDDGCGMDARDALLALERHATSKIRCAEDLGVIATLGFRGEALPSIASVCLLVLRTRLHGAQAGTEVRVVSGHAPEAAPCGCAPGTVVEARELFYNVPARRKFLRATSTESAHITEVVQAAALAHPAVSFTLVRDGRTAREWLRAPERRARVQDSLPGHALCPCSGRRGPVEIDALLTMPEDARTGASGLYLFVNGRHIQDRALARAVASAYGDALDPGRYPIGAVFIEIDPGLVDVNVHPQKAEVRFAHARAASDAVYAVLRESLAPALGRPPRPPEPGGRAPWPSRRGPEGSPGKERWQWPTPERAEHAPGTAATPLGAPAAPPLPAPAAAPAADAEPLRLVATLRERYLVCEHAGGLLVLGAHAAAERVIHERLRRAAAQGPVPAVALLFPLVEQVGDAAAAAVESAADRLAEIGLELRRAGPGAVSLHGVPALLGSASPERLLALVLDRTRQHAGAPLAGRSEGLLGQLACLAATSLEPQSEPLGPGWLRELAPLVLGSGAPVSPGCPHGEPVLLRVSWRELEGREGCP